VYFGRAEQQVLSRTSDTADPIHSVRIAINVIYGVVVGLVMLAAGIEIVLAHLHDANAGVPGVLVLAGPMTYLLS
jgi:hypothetical protein